MAGATIDELGRPAELHVRHFGGIGPDVGRDAVVRERFPRRRADELQRRCSGDDGDVVAGLGQLAQQVGGLVRGDTAGDTQDDPLHGFSVTRVGAEVSSRRVRPRA